MNLSNGDYLWIGGFVVAILIIIIYCAASGDPGSCFRGGGGITIGIILLAPVLVFLTVMYDKIKARMQKKS